MTPQQHPTSVKLDHDVYVILQTLQAQRADLNQTQLINLAIRFYYHHADNPELDAMTSNIAAIRKQLDELLTRGAPTIDPHILASEIIAQLDAREPPEAPSRPLVKETTTPTPDPTKPRWSERFAKRFGKPPVEHW